MNKSNNLISNIATLLVNEYIIVNFDSEIMMITTHNSEEFPESQLTECQSPFSKRLNIDEVRCILDSPISLNKDFTYKVYIYEEHLNQIRDLVNEKLR